MRKNIVRFFIQIFSLTIGVAISLSLILSLALNIKWELAGDRFSFLKTVFLLGTLSGVQIFFIGLFAFIVKIDQDGIRRNFFTQRILWKDIISAKISGISSIKFSRKLVLSGDKENIEIYMFIFDDQEVFLKELKKYLPWAESLQLINLPSVAEK